MDESTTDILIIRDFIITSQNSTDDDFLDDELSSTTSIAARWLPICVLLQAMFGIGCSVSIEELKEHIRHPFSVGITAVNQFIVIPLVVFGVRTAVNTAKIPALVTLITASLPGGGLSNLLVYYCKGDFPLSVWTTLCSSAIAVIFVPFNLLIYGSWWRFDDIYTELLLTAPVVTISLLLLPVLITSGILINWKWSRIALKIGLICKITTSLSLLSLVALCSLVYKDALLRHMPVELWGMCALLPPIGYFLGYICAFASRHDHITRRTVAIEIMCQNGLLGCIVLKLAFPGNVIENFLAFPLFYSAFQFVEGMMLILFFQCYQRNESNEENEKENFFKIGNASLGNMRRVSLYVIDRMRLSFSRSRSEDKLSTLSSLEEEQYDDVTSNMDQMPSNHGRIFIGRLPTIYDAPDEVEDTAMEDTKKQPSVLDEDEVFETPSSDDDNN